MTGTKIKTTIQDLIERINGERKSHSTRCAPGAHLPVCSPLSARLYFSPQTPPPRSTRSSPAAPAPSSPASAWASTPSSCSSTRWSGTSEQGRTTTLRRSDTSATRTCARCVLRGGGGGRAGRGWYAYRTGKLMQGSGSVGPSCRRAAGQESPGGFKPALPPKTY